MSWPLTATAMKMMSCSRLSSNGSEPTSSRRKTSSPSLDACFSRSIGGVLVRSCE
jgi:hypothetical protein